MLGRDQKIIVVGAGFAGLTALYRLYELGYRNIALYEARLRPGGRVLSARILQPEGETIAELGGQNVPDGGEAPYLKSMLKVLGLSLVEDTVNIEQVFYDAASKKYIDILKYQKERFKKEALPKLKEKIKKIATQSQNMEEVLLTLFPEKDFLYRSLVCKFSAYEGEHPKYISTDAFENLYYMLCGGLASVHATNQIERATIQGGNAQFALTLAEKLNDFIYYGHPLKSIRMAEKEGVFLNFEGLGTQQCDRLVLAIPATVYGDITMEGPLQEKAAFIQKIPYGSNAKIMTPVQIQKVKKNSILMDDVNIFFSEKDLAILYYSADKGRHLKQHLVTYFNESIDALKTIYPAIQYSSNDPQEVSDNIQLMRYEGPITHSWIDDPYAKGSYSYRSPEVTNILNYKEIYYGETVRTPYYPVNDRIFFAGEHTAVEADFGTLEGAVESGFRAARMLQCS